MIHLVSKFWVPFFNEPHAVDPSDLIRARLLDPVEPGASGSYLLSIAAKSTFAVAHNLYLEHLKTEN